LLEDLKNEFLVIIIHDFYLDLFMSAVVNPG